MFPTPDTHQIQVILWSFKLKHSQSKQKLTGPTTNWSFKYWFKHSCTDCKYIQGHIADAGTKVIMVQVHLSTSNSQHLQLISVVVQNKSIS